MLSILILFSLLFKAWTSQISGHGNSEAAYGGKAIYRCAIDNPAGVLQVTWQRLFRDESIENLATYSKRFGLQVNEPYRGKVTFTETSLSSTSITLNNVTWEDESCYICSFNVYPDGSKRKQTCLKVQGIAEVKTAVHVPGIGPDGVAENMVEVVFSCQATGKPAPTIEWAWDPPGADNSNTSQTTIVSNRDSTFTSSSNLTLQLPTDWNKDVYCVLNKGKAGQTREKMSFTLPAGNKKTEGETRSWSGTVLAVILVIIISSIVAGAVMWRRRLKGKGRTENV